MNVIGISHLEPFAQYFHDTNVGFVSQGQPRFAALEERYSRLKHHAGYPVGALSALRRAVGLTLADVDVLALPERRDPETLQVTNGSAEGFSRAALTKALGLRGELFFCDHQLAHASVAYRLSGFDDALIVTLDGMGHDLGQPCYGAVFSGKDNQINRLKTCWSQGESLGLFYGLVTEALGWAMSDGEGKTMALATSGDAERLYDRLAQLAPSVTAGQLAGGRMFKPTSVVVNHRHHIVDPTIADLRDLADTHGRENVAAAAQAVLETVVTDWIGALLREFPDTSNVALGGGIFLNVSLNSRLRRNFPDITFFVPPSPADGGIGLGAALEAAARSGGSRPRATAFQYLGSHYSFDPSHHDMDGLAARELSDPAEAVAAVLERGEVVGVFQGGSEWGPRALGNRSVLAHPGLPGMRDRINRQMKRREHFMPFAPVVMAEQANHWFDAGQSLSPYMMFTYEAHERLRSQIGSVPHSDGTARIQTLRETENRLIHDVLGAFFRRTGLPLLLNTSFNLHGLPMIESPADALDHLRWGCVDCLCFGEVMVYRR